MSFPRQLFAHTSSCLSYTHLRDEMKCDVRETGTGVLLKQMCAKIKISSREHPKKYIKNALRAVVNLVASVAREEE